MNQDSIETQPERSAADYRTTTAETETKTRTVQEPAACYTAAPAPLPLTIHTIPGCRTRKEVMLREAPIYPEKCARWTQRPELLNRRTLNALLYQCKSVEVLAKYLNCSKQQVYAAMDFHKIPRARYSTSIAMRHTLRL